MRNLILIFSIFCFQFSLSAQPKPTSTSTKSSSSISISETDDNYNYHASFSDNDLRQSIHELISSKINIKASKRGKKVIWNDSDDNYSIVLKSHKLTAEIDLKETSKSEADKIIAILKEASLLMNSKVIPVTPATPYIHNHN